MGIDYFDQIWRTKDLKSSYKEGSADSWDNRVEEFTGIEPDDRIMKIIELLTVERMLREDSTVLDIGCGPGRFAAEFARKAKSVTGVDISTKMLRTARDYVAAQELQNVDFIEMDWLQDDLSARLWKQKFSLVTAIMSPGIGSRESLEKMIAASSRYCFLSHFIERHDPISDELKRRFLPPHKEDVYGNKGLYCCFNILWLKKLYPEITYIETARESVRTLDEANRHYITRLGMKTDLTDEQKADIRNYIQSKEKNGLIRETVTGKIACIYWRVATV
ncbi:methyltransferase [Dehalobacter sp. UNSWDHB]|uniref:class I SAM-dependent methyltransferase n=1 Tax=unclassified Dehalobacter TaxID=2635733 RepID=UPI00028AD64F|nr:MULTISPECIES: class I SAM-dependent methyltransferase [unclassified Dehalobacter]AFV01782.1 methyltransferase [Dehalobacter sp. DCA]AFV04818.1 methyltransferase [Dehalobacter sp. CF]EQB19820.1 methyltransferase [Dehalobacter sp. UNSWDHB]